MTLYEAIPLEPAFHLVETDRAFVPSLRHDGQVVEVFHDLLVTFGRDNHRRPPTLGIDYELISQYFHVAKLHDATGRYKNTPPATGLAFATRYVVQLSHCRNTYGRMPPWR